MTRTTHFSAEAGLPVYALAFLTDDVLVYVGGGGAGRSGVGNAFRAVRINEQGQELFQLSELKLSRDEDAPMCLALDRKTAHLVCGVNSVASKTSVGGNEALRIYRYEMLGGEEPAAAKDSTAVKEEEAEKGAEKPSANSVSVELSFVRAARSLDISNPEQYMKVATFSPDGRMLAVGSTDGLFALHRFPSLAPAWTTASAVSSAAASGADGVALPSSDFLGQELYDTDFSDDGSQVVVASAGRLKVYETTAKATSNSSDASTVSPPAALQTIQNPALGGQGPCTFRAARFGHGDPSEGGTRERIFTVVNATQAKGKGKNKSRKSFVTAWDADTWQLIETRNVSDRPVTVFDVSADGTLLAYGSSDLSVGVLDARTLRPIFKILHAHDFPPTCLRFSPSGRTLVSASADNTLRVISVPTARPGAAVGLLTQSASTWLTVAIALILVAIAVVLQRQLSL